MRRLAILLLLPLGCSACAPEGTLALRLLRAGCEDPYQGVTELRVRSLDGAGVERGRFLVAAGAPRVDVGATDGANQRLVIEGLGGGQVLARGTTRLLRPSAGGPVEEVVPFATLGAAVAAPAALAHPTPLVIDGALDEWRVSPALLLDDASRVAGPAASATDVSAELRLAWGPDRLDFALHISDDSLLLRDCAPAGSCAAGAVDRVAFGFDGGGDGGDVYGAADLWFEVRATGVTVLAGALTPVELPLAVAVDADGSGWTIEGSLLLGALGRTGITPAKDKVGLEVVVYDEDPGQPEPTVLRWTSRASWTGQPTPPAALGSLGFAASR